MNGIPGLPPEMVGAFRDRMARDAATLGQLRAGLFDDGAPRPLAGDPLLEELDRLAHGLVGAGATFGFAEVTAAAEDVEHLTGLRPAFLDPADAEARHLLRLAVERLQDALTAASGAPEAGTRAT